MSVNALRQGFCRRSVGEASHPCAPVLVVLTVLAMLAIAGCSSSPTTSGAQPGGDPTGSADDGATKPSSGKGKKKSFDGTIGEFVGRLVACLKADGWDVDLAPEGDGLLPHIPEGQQAAYDTSHRKCMHKLGDAPGTGTPSHAEMVRLYEFVKGTVACLRAHGWPATDPPSLDTFIQDNFFTHGMVDRHIWFAYDEVSKDRTLMTTKWDEINETCPQSPT